MLIVGTDSLAAEVRKVGLKPVRQWSDGPVAVVQGHSPQTGWPDLAEAALAIRGGALWVAANVDLTLPSERGLLPGNGSMVAALRAATDAQPQVAGKPHEPAAAWVRRHLGPDGVMVGDRPDTDGRFALALGYRFGLVLSGVTTAADLPTDPPGDLVAPDLATLVAGVLGS